MSWALAVGLTTVLAAQGPSAPEEPATQSAEVAERVRWDGSYAEFRRRAGELVSTHPDIVRAEVVATGANGRELVVLSAEPVRETPDAPPLPAVLLMAGEGAFDSVRCFELFAEFVRQRELDDRVAMGLERVALFAIPFLELQERRPDRRYERFAEDVRSNFPSYWETPGVHPGAGPYPLSTPEALAVATFFAEHPSLAVILQIGRAQPRSVSLVLAAEAIDARDRRILGALERSVPGVRFDGGIPGRSGGPLEFAYDRFGIFPFQLWGAPQTEGEFSPVPDGWTDVLFDLAGALPALALSVEQVEDLGDRLWSVGVTVTNRGAFPTTSRRGLERWVTRGAWLDVSGARVAGVGRRAVDGVLEERTAIPGPDAESRIPLGVLAPEFSVSMKLLVIGEPGTEMSLRARDLRAGQSVAELRLGALEAND